MSPRPYKLGRRQAATDQTRANILGAARTLLVAPEGVSGFTLEAVAKAADVSRMTVYYQFESKIGLLEALCDTLSIMRGADRIVAAMSLPDPWASLDGLIEAFAGFWTEDRAIQRRLQALAELDPEVDRVMSSRGQRLTRAMRVILGRMKGPDDALDELADRLSGLLSFRCVDALAGERSTPEAIAPLLKRLARSILAD
jgi:AcrR family transcriptional regulator